MKRRITAEVFLGHPKESPWPLILGLIAAGVIAGTAAVVMAGLAAGVGL